MLQPPPIAADFRAALRGGQFMVGTWLTFLDPQVPEVVAGCGFDLLIADGEHGRMVAIRDGHYSHTTLPDPKLGPRSVDVERLYDVDRFRPKYSGKLGEPLLLLGTPALTIA